MMPVAFLGVGSNRGDRAANLRRAVHELTDVPEVRAVRTSPVYETQAHTRTPDTQRPAFLNAVVEVKTRLSPEELFRVTQKIEGVLGRTRKRTAWAPRTIDIDILAYEGETRENERLTLPHPRLANRKFVLRPWADLRPNFVVPPPFDEAVHTLLDQCPDTASIRRTELRLPRSEGAGRD